jgi:hypothetical protein
MDDNIIDTLSRVICADGWAMAEGTLFRGAVVVNLFSWLKTMGWIFYGDFPFEGFEAHAGHFGMPATLEARLLSKLEDTNAAAPTG